MPSPFTPSFASAASGTAANETNFNGRNPVRVETGADWWVFCPIGLVLSLNLRVKSHYEELSWSQAILLQGREPAPMVQRKHFDVCPWPPIYQIKEIARQTVWSLRQVQVYMFHHIWIRATSLMPIAMAQPQRIAIPRTSYSIYLGRKIDQAKQIRTWPIYLWMDGIQWMAPTMAAGAERTRPKTPPPVRRYAGITKVVLLLLPRLKWEKMRKKYSLCNPYSKSLYWLCH